MHAATVVEMRSYSDKQALLVVGPSIVVPSRHVVNSLLLGICAAMLSTSNL
jgi:hypothetical protein